MIRRLGFAVAALAALAACHERGHTIRDVYLTRPENRAAAEVRPTEGHTAQGTVVFTEVEGGVRVRADLRGLTPGPHGFHVHEGDCDAPDGSSALGHYNPSGAPHAGPDAASRHVGDLGNLEADDRGRATLDRIFDGLSLEGAHTIVGRSVIVHAGADDLSSQPAGNAGARVGCGMILR